MPDGGTDNRIGRNDVGHFIPRRVRVVSGERDVVRADGERATASLSPGTSQCSINKRSPGPHDLSRVCAGRGVRRRF